MKLPEHLQHFPKPTLVIASDSVSAKFFLLGGDSLEELDGVTVPRERRQDDEGSFSSDGNARTGDPNADMSDAPRMHEFIHQLIEHTGELVAKHSITHIHLVMPAEVEHQFASHLSNDDRGLVGQTLHLDLMKSSPIEIVERLLND
jgi:hypothetical protein